MERGTCVRCAINEADAWYETDWYSGEEALCVRCAEELQATWRNHHEAIREYRESGAEMADMMCDQ